MNLQEAKNILGKEYYIELVSKLRNSKVINLYDYEQKYFVKIQINRTYEKIAFQRFVSKDKNNWVEHNSYLHITDIVFYNAQLKQKNLERIKY
jgi:hypothetical protein